MYKLVIFDMDGTILDTLLDLTNAVNYALDKAHLPLRSIDEVRNFVGNGIVNLMKRAIGKELSKDEFDIIFKDFCDFYEVHCDDNTKPYDGIIDLLKKLRANNIKTAVVSNKAHFGVKKLVDIHFNGLFDEYQGATDKIKIKPNPDSVNAIIDKFKINKENVVYVGDSEVDIMTAKNAGINCISVTWGFKSEEFLIKNNAQKIVHDSKELEKLLIK